jgi:carbon monoxide dehydrogenase subunit G
MKIRKIVRVQKPIEAVFAYLSDFTTTTQWDPGTVVTVRNNGDGSIGTEYLNTSTFAGRQTQLKYVVKEFILNQRIGLQGENKTVIAYDTMSFRQIGTETEVTYRADFTYKGISRLLAIFLTPAFARLGNEAEVGMAHALSQL